MCGARLLSLALPCMGFACDCRNEFFSSPLRSRWGNIGAVGSRANVDVGFDAGLLLITLPNRLSESLGMRSVHQVNGATAKAAAGHSASPIPGKAFRHFDHEIQFAAADFIQVAKAAVGF